MRLEELGFSEIRNVPLLAPLSFTDTCFNPVFFTKLVKTDYKGEIQRWLMLFLSLLLRLHSFLSPSSLPVIHRCL